MGGLNPGYSSTHEPSPARQSTVHLEMPAFSAIPESQLVMAIRSWTLPPCRVVVMVEDDLPRHRLLTRLLSIRTSERQARRPDRDDLVRDDGQFSNVYFQIRVGNIPFTAMTLPQTQTDTGSVHPLQASSLTVRVGF